MPDNRDHNSLLRWHSVKVVHYHTSLAVDTLVRTVTETQPSFVAISQLLLLA